MKQFFRGSGITAFFYFIIAVFCTFSVTLFAKTNSDQIAYAIYYGELDSTAATDESADNTLVALIFLGIVFLLFVNIFSVTGHWLREKRGEIRARTIAGGSAVRICSRLLFNYAVIILLSSAVGVAVAGWFLSLELLVIDGELFFTCLLQICGLTLALSAVGALTGAMSIWKAHEKLTRRD